MATVPRELSLPGIPLVTWPALGRVLPHWAPWAGHRGGGVSEAPESTGLGSVRFTGSPLRGRGPRMAGALALQQDRRGCSGRDTGLLKGSWTCRGTRGGKAGLVSERRQEI